MKKCALFLLIVTISFLLPSVVSAQSKQSAPSTASIQMIQFHSQHRCLSCRTIEKFTREVVANYPSILFKLINVDQKKNEALANEFEASGTALFLFNPKTGKKKSLTDFGFMNVGNEEKFKELLKQHIDEFIKG